MGLRTRPAAGGVDRQTQQRPERSTAANFGRVGEVRFGFGGLFEVWGGPPWSLNEVDIWIDCDEEL